MRLYDGEFREVDVAGSWSSGTHRVDQIIDGITPLLEASREGRELLIDFGDILEDESIDPDELLADMFDLLDEQAPQGFYFGAHPGDGSDFGYWEIDEYEGDD